MGKLVKISTWRKERFAEGEAPTRGTIIKAIEEGELPGKRIGRDYWIDVDEEQNQSGNDYFDKIMEHP